MNVRMKCIVVDDEPLARELIKSYITRTPGLELIAEFETAGDALDTVVSQNVDVIFLDINMLGLSGIDFAGLVPPAARIIYITAYDRYAVQGFRVNALDYLLKPVSYDDFLRAVGKAVSWMQMRQALENGVRRPPEFLTVKSENRIVQIRLDTILYVEVRNDRVIIFRADGNQTSSFMSMREIEELLPTDRFMRVHRSFIVNLSKVEVVERNRIIFGKTSVPVSDAKKDGFISRLR